MFDVGGAILSLVESAMTPPQNREPRASLTPPEIAYKVVFCFVVAGLAQFLLVGMFNLANHPLADFPGPRSAAFTEWYKTYRELYCGESWVDVLEELHKKYGILTCWIPKIQANFVKGKLSELAQMKYVKLCPS